MRTLLSRVKINKKYLAGLLVLMLVGAVTEMMLPTLLAAMIDRRIAEESRSYIILIAIIMAVMAAVTSAKSLEPSSVRVKAIW